MNIVQVKIWTMVKKKYYLNNKLLVKCYLKRRWQYKERKEIKNQINIFNE